MNNDIFLTSPNQLKYIRTFPFANSKAIMDHRIITPENCEDTSGRAESLRIDFLSALFIVRKKYILSSGIRRLGYFWNFLEPVLGAMVFVWIFTILRAHEPDWINSVFIGFGLIGGYNVGLRYAMNSRVDEGGLRIERVRARALVLSRVLGMMLDSIFSASGVALALLLLGADPPASTIRKPSYSSATTGVLLTCLLSSERGQFVTSTKP